MYLGTRNTDYWAIDIEGDGLPSNVVWCLCGYNLRTKEEVTLTSYEEIKTWVDNQKKNGAKFIGHNIIGYDGPTLNRLCGTSLTIADMIDTMVMSMVYSPSLDGGHSLEEWGQRLSFPKIEFNDFSRLTPEMLIYCMQDTKLCAKVFESLIGRMRKIGFSDEGLEIEHRAWDIIRRQRINGFKFNLESAHILYAKLRAKEQELSEKIYEYWPPQLQCVATFAKALKQNGEPTANYLRHKQQYVEIRLLDDGRYEAFDYVYFNIGSPEQRVAKLLELGWVPIERTKPSKKFPEGSPQATRKGQLSPSLQAFVEESGKDEVRLIAQWIEYNARANMINTWIEAYDDETGCIHGGLWLANTLRYRHSNPNTANIPAVRVSKEGSPLLGESGVFTYEARDLWTVRDLDRVLVGVDAKGIQLRVLAHYLNNKDFTDAVLSGDPHSYNQEIGGFGSRAIAKTFIYAFLLGAGDAKVGQIIGGTTRDGREVKKRFVSNFPGLGDLLADLEGQINRTGRIILCDGTPLLVSQSHTRLGYLLQGDESRIMKKAAILVDRENRRRKLDVLKVGDIHDEWQNDVLKLHSEEFAEDVCPTAFGATGEHFRYRIPIACDSKIGLTWAETH